MKCKKCGKKLYKRKSWDGKDVWKHKKKLGQGYVFSPHC